MDKLPMCRVCLCEDARMYSLFDTHLQAIYERLTSKPLSPAECRSVKACYICCAKLRSCEQLRRSCVQSGELLARVLSGESSSVHRLETRKGHSLSVTEVVNLTVGGTPHDTSEATVKVESELFIDIVVKQERDEDAEETTSEKNTTEEDKALVGTSGEGGLSVKRDHKDVDTDTPAPSGSCQPSSSTSDCPPPRGRKRRQVTPREHTVRLVRDLIAEGRPFYYQCRACKKSFYEVHRLNAHICSEKDKKPHKCDICDQRFKLKSRLIYHVQKHSEERNSYQCDICKKEFEKKYQLSYHIRLHTGEKPYQCEVCQKRFFTRNYLIKHAPSHSKARPYECNLCNKTFKGKSNLKVHLQRHTGEKNYQCNVCKKSFNYNGNLKKHMQIHSGERPHSCAVGGCAKRFINNSDLVKHRRTHTPSGAKPYRCLVCNETFNYNSNFLKHKRVRCKSVNVD